MERNKRPFLFVASVAVRSRVSSTEFYCPVLL